MADPKRIGAMLPGSLGRAAGLLANRNRQIDAASGYSSGPRKSSKKKKKANRKVDDRSILDTIMSLVK